MFSKFHILHVEVPPLDIRMSNDGLMFQANRHRTALQLALRNLASSNKPRNRGCFWPPEQDQCVKVTNLRSDLPPPDQRCTRAFITYMQVVLRILNLQVLLDSFLATETRQQPYMATVLANQLQGLLPNHFYM